jgi:hypothetical protein
MSGKLPYTASLQQALSLLDQSGVFNPNLSPPQSPGEKMSNVWLRALRPSVDGCIASARTSSSTVIAVDSLNGGLADVCTSGRGLYCPPTSQDVGRNLKGVLQDRPHASHHHSSNREASVAASAQSSDGQQRLQDREQQSSGAATQGNVKQQHLRSSVRQSLDAAARSIGTHQELAADPAPKVSSAIRSDNPHSGNVRRSSGHPASATTTLATPAVGCTGVSRQLGAALGSALAPFALSSDSNVAGMPVGAVRAYARPPEPQQGVQSLLGMTGACDGDGCVGMQTTSQAGYSEPCMAAIKHGSVAVKSSSSCGQANDAIFVAENTGVKPLMRLCVMLLYYITDLYVDRLILCQQAPPMFGVVFLQWWLVSS